MTYDSRTDTKAHIGVVQSHLSDVIFQLARRAEMHDLTKLIPPEVEVFDEMTPKLKGSTYGSDEYKSFLKHMKPALDHHYAHNTHHPEHFENGVDGMSLLDLIEMLCDWKAATERHDDGSIYRSLSLNKDRFNISPQLYQILINTVKELGFA